MNTRSISEVWLIGQPSADILGCRLPTKLQVLKKVKYHQIQEKLGRTKCLNLCLDTILPFWHRARIPIMRRDNALRKMEALLTRYDKLVKNRRRPQESFRVQEEMFQSELKNEIFDIGHSNALTMMKNEEDKLFYKSQQEDQTESSMAGVDTKLHKNEIRKRKRDKESEHRRTKEEERVKKATERANNDTGNCTSSGTDSENNDSSFEAIASTSLPASKRSKNLISGEVSIAFDRMNMSHRDAAMSYAIVAKSLGHDLKALSISPSTMYRARRSLRKHVAESYQEEAFCVDYNNLS